MDLYGYCLDNPVNGIDPSGLGARWDMLEQGLGNLWDGFTSIPAAFGEAYRNVNQQLPPAVDELYGDKGPYEETTVGDRLLHTSILSSRFGTAAGSGYPGFSNPVFSVGGGVVGGVAGFNAGLATQGIAELTGHGRDIYETSRRIRSYSDDDPAIADLGPKVIQDVLGLLW